MPMKMPSVAQPALPAEAARRLDADARHAAQHLRRGTPRPAARTTPSTAATPPRPRCPRRPARRAPPCAIGDLRAGGDQRRLARALRLGQHVAAAGAAVLGRRRCAAPAAPGGSAPAGSARRCAGSPVPSTPPSPSRRPGGSTCTFGHGAQAGQVLDRLVGRPVLAEADGVMRQHVDHPLAHQRAPAASPGACSR